jgi:predicted transcriptional regulator
MATKGGRRSPGTLEAEVMGVLWQSSPQTPLTAADVQGRLGDGLAYNTVQTILTRLFEKGLVERCRAGRGHGYWAARDAAATAAAQMNAALAGHGDRRTVLQQFAASLDPQDTATLLEILGNGL